MLSRDLFAITDDDVNDVDETPVVSSRTIVEHSRRILSVGKRSATVWRPSVRLSVPSAYSLSLTKLSRAVV